MDNLVSILKIPALNHDVKSTILRFIQNWSVAFEGKSGLSYVGQVYKTLLHEGECLLCWHGLGRESMMPWLVTIQGTSSLPKTSLLRTRLWWTRRQPQSGSTRRSVSDVAHLSHSPTASTIVGIVVKSLTRLVLQRL